MGSVYRRGDSPFLWIGYTDASGKRRLFSSGMTDEEEAKRTLLDLERRVLAEKQSGLAPGGPITVERYAAKWIEGRRERHLDSADDDRNRIRHALPIIGRMPIKDVGRAHIRDLIRALEKGGELAPRTMLHVYGVLRVMFDDAVIEGLVSQTPCTLRRRRRELPKKQDKDPRWRVTAIFERQEIEALISDARIPERRRVLHGIKFLCGVRVNEVTPRRWVDYDAESVPLGKLTFATSFASKRKAEKNTKTGNAREVPVHPTLAKLLAKWKLSGWAATYGRPPRPDDLMIPAPPHHRGRRTPEEATGIRMSSGSELKRLHEDLTLLGFRLRRQHDCRRTFMTLAQVDGGRREVLETITHDPKGDVTSLYTSFPWPTRCEAVAAINVQLREGQLLPLAPTGGATRLLRESEVLEMMDEKNGGGGNRSLSQTDSEGESAGVSALKDKAAALGFTLLECQGTSERSDVADEYERRAVAAGFRVVFRSGA